MWRPTVSKFAREVLRLESLTLVDDLRDVASHLRTEYPDLCERDFAICMFVQRYRGRTREGDVSSLQAIADTHGTTRDRVRWIIDGMLRCATKHTIFSQRFRAWSRHCRRSCRYPTPMPRTRCVIC
jgi:hypothetical protein